MRKFGWLFWLMMPGMAASAQTAAVTNYCVLGATSANTSGLQSINKLQGIIPRCTVTVYLTGTTTKATVYADAGNTPLTNPFTANSVTGQWLFYASTGQGYDVVMSGGVGPNVYPFPVTLTDQFAGGGSGGASTLALLGSGTAPGPGPYNFGNYEISTTDAITAFAANNNATTQGGELVNNYRNCTFDQYISFSNGGCARYDYTSTIAGTARGSGQAIGGTIVQYGQFYNMRVQGQGTIDGTTITLLRGGAGDTNLIGAYGSADDQVAAPDDEGFTGLNVNGQILPTPTGTISSGTIASTGTTIALSTSNAPAALGVGRAFIDTDSSTVISTTATVATATSAYDDLTIAATVTAGLCSSMTTTVPTPLPTNGNNGKTPMTFVGPTGLAIAAGDTLFFHGDAEEFGKVTAVAGGVITVPLANSFTGTTQVCKGGLAGAYMEQTSWTINGAPYLLRVIGSTGIHTIRVSSSQNTSTNRFVSLGNGNIKIYTVGADILNVNNPSTGQFDGLNLLVDVAPVTWTSGHAYQQMGKAPAFTKGFKAQVQSNNTYAQNSGGLVIHAGTGFAPGYGLRFQNQGPNSLLSTHGGYGSASILLDTNSGSSVTGVYSVGMDFTYAPEASDQFHHAGAINVGDFASGSTATDWWLAYVTGGLGVGAGVDFIPSTKTWNFFDHIQEAGVSLCRSDGTHCPGPGTGVPTIANASGAGTSPGTPTITGTNSAFVITVTTGTTPLSGAALATVTFGSGPLTTAPLGCAITPRNDNAAGVNSDFFTTAPSTTAWTIFVGDTPFAASSTFSWYGTCK